MFRELISFAITLMKFVFLKFNYPWEKTKALVDNFSLKWGRSYYHNIQITGSENRIDFLWLKVSIGLCNSNAEILKEQRVNTGLDNHSKICSLTPPSKKQDYAQELNIFVLTSSLVKNPF